MSSKNKISALLGASALGAALALAVPAIALPAASAATIHRIECQGRTDFTYVFSNATTCWASPGTATVNLYNVNGVRGGSNSGYIQSGSLTPDYFFKTQDRYGVAASHSHIQRVHIN